MGPWSGAWPSTDRFERDVRGHQARPARASRTADGGKTWDKLPVEIALDCPNVGIPRPPGCGGPHDHRHVWVRLEVDGVRHSRDGGETWTRWQPDPQPGRAQCPRRRALPRPCSPWSTTTSGAAPTTARPGAARAREVFPWHYPAASRSSRTSQHGVRDARRLDAGPHRDGDALEGRRRHVAEPGAPVQPNSAMWTVSIPRRRPTRSSPRADVSIAATTAIPGASGASSARCPRSSGSARS